MAQYRMPAEWEPHAGTWLTWPHNIPNTWYEGLEAVSKAFAWMVHHLSKGEKVNIICHDPSVKALALKHLEMVGFAKDNVNFHDWATNDSWIRDYGPIYVFDSTGKKVILNWEYNAWGGKYPSALDNAIPSQIAKKQHVELVSPGIILEGGSIDVNGKGLLVTTKACLLNQNRNNTLTQAEIGLYLEKYLGVEKVIWLGDGVAGDDTDGHVDDMVRFVDENTLVYAYETNLEDENYEALHQNFLQLQKATNLKGQALNLIALPMPSPVYYKNERLPASYANFYIGNSTVVVPTYRCENDEKALAILKNCFPDRHVVGIDFYECILGLGSLHCLSQQEPA